MPDIILQPDLATIKIQIKLEDQEPQDCEVDVTNLCILAEPATDKHIPDGGEKDWKPTPAFNNHLAELFNEADILPVTLTPTDAYTLYFTMLERWAELKKNMSFLPTSANSTEAASPELPPKKS